MSDFSGVVGGEELPPGTWNLPDMVGLGWVGSAMGLSGREYIRRGKWCLFIVVFVAVWESRLRRWVGKGKVVWMDGFGLVWFISVGPQRNQVGRIFVLHEAVGMYVCFVTNSILWRSVWYGDERISTLAAAQSEL